MSTTQEWIDELKNISVLELSERIKALEEAFGVSATAVAAAAPAAAPTDGAGEAAEEQTAFPSHGPSGECPFNAARAGERQAAHAVVNQGRRQQPEAGGAEHEGRPAPGERCHQTRGRADSIGGDGADECPE